MPKLWKAIHNRYNEYMPGDKFFVSYANTHKNPMLKGWGQGDGDGIETALKHDNSDYLVLNGDHREAYAALIPQGYAACLQYYSTQRDLASSWTMEKMEETSNA